MINKTKTKQNKEKTKQKETNNPHPTQLGMSSNECRIPNVSICRTMSLKLVLLICSTMSSDVI